MQVEITRFTKKTAYEPEEIGQIDTIHFTYENMTFTLECSWTESPYNTAASLSQLLTPGHKACFGDCYGSHVDNGKVVIYHQSDGQVEFKVDGARGGIITFTIPFEKVKNAIEKVIAAFRETMLTKQGKNEVA